MDDKITIIIADDHPLMREALRAHLSKQDDFEILGEAADGEEAVKLAAELKPNLIIIDISMPNLNGIEATKLIKAKSPDTRILVLTVHSDYERIYSILKAGASGYLTKAALGNEVVQSIKSIISGETVFAPSVSQELIKHSTKDDTNLPTTTSTRIITSREREILKLAADGLNNKEIAQKMNLSVATIKGHFVEIFEKLEVKSRTEAVITCIKSGLISLKE